MRFKVTLAGQRPQVVTLAADATFGDLTAKIAELFAMTVEEQVLLAGYPPQPVQTQGASQPLLEVFPTGREAITVTTAPPSSASSGLGSRAAPVTISAATQGRSEAPGASARIVKVPSDNSCLFNCVAQALGLARPGDPGFAGVVAKVRRVVAATIRKNSELYSEATLGKPVEVYCEWIQDPRSWGGEIEMSILANHFGVEIAVIAVEDGKEYQYSPGLGLERAAVDFGASAPRDPSAFCVLIYDGIHYDFVEDSGRGLFTGDFAKHPTADAARGLASELRRKKAFTNRNTFTLRCNQCGAECVGQERAMAHAQETGHNDFGQQ